MTKGPQGFAVTRLHLTAILIFKEAPYLYVSRYSFTFRETDHNLLITYQLLYEVNQM